MAALPVSLPSCFPPFAAAAHYLATLTDDAATNVAPSDAVRRLVRRQHHGLDWLFAGIWRSWRGIRGSNRSPRDGEHQLFAFLTCESNAVVKPVHPKAMPVILTSAEKIEIWLTADWAEAKRLRMPVGNEELVDVTTTTG